jgi:hypothetical protein
MGDAAAWLEHAHDLADRGGPPPAASGMLCRAMLETTTSKVCSSSGSWPASPSRSSTRSATPSAWALAIVAAE